jgi:hypothetical protein
VTADTKPPPPTDKASTPLPDIEASIRKEVEGINAARFQGRPVMGAVNRDFDPLAVPLGQTPAASPPEPPPLPQMLTGLQSEIGDFEARLQRQIGDFEARLDARLVRIQRALGITT